MPTSVEVLLNRVVFYVLLPLLAILIYAFGGWLVSMTPLGGWVCMGAALFGLHILPSQLWLVSSFLGFVGHYFRDTHANYSKKKEAI